MSRRSLSFMASYRQFDSHDSFVPVVGYVTFIGLIFLTFFSFLLWLSKPVILANPGVAAYKPPPATRLERAPGKMDAPKVAAVPESLPEAERAQPNVAESGAHKQMCGRKFAIGRGSLPDGSISNRPTPRSKKEIAGTTGQKRHGGHPGNPSAARRLWNQPFCALFQDG
jgi:hypothetical protein